METFNDRMTRARSEGFPNAGKRWSKDDDAELVRLAGLGDVSIEQMTVRFGRQTGAILKRLAFHGLIEQQPHSTRAA